jgi:tRNA (guanine-N7-)-methyltransferase
MIMSQIIGASQEEMADAAFAEGFRAGGVHVSHVYGRRRARGLTDRQAEALQTGLPALQLNLQEPAPELLAEVFAASVDEVWLEIGFGGGEHLAWQAEANPRAGIIGCEPFVNGVAKLLCEIEDRRISNVRVYDDDARHLLDWLPGGSVSRAFILFPDPWPKRRHWKRRFVSEVTLTALARAMRPGAELRFASDSGLYTRAILALTRRQKEFRWEAETPRDWRERPSGWPSTRYEEKAIRAGRKPNYLRFRKI